MKKILVGILAIGILLFAFRYCEWKSDDNTTIIENTQTIQQQLKKVGKLIVTEGHFSEVYNYKDQQKYLMDYIRFEKKALAVVNAEVTIAYDLSLLTYEIDEVHKVLRITSIPKEEIRIHPTIKFYDVDQSIMNPFTGDDYNLIQQKVKQQLLTKIEGSKFKKNAKNQLLTELSKIYILTNSLGWTLQYNHQQIQNESELEVIKG